ncbi:Methyltransferase type 11 [Solidesulfovibrio fructosivorans JJ]]|uniref:Methyltransferase type 11 n=1 Tax=Solidesulfovibrio fructosivorans JJ] TaxID=596151 RepID=E1JS24_SOLFR|nr:tetratricopeptide repeat protein [Solidesulfovibrio fructosivorans]EFL52793.1 Methyltransferase type 11 [Solidesulfovibrio fructosivorans JJ]]
MRMSEEAPPAASLDPVREEKLAIVALVNAGGRDEAERRADALALRLPQDVFGFSVSGTLRLTRGDAAGAVARLTRAAALAPDVADIRTNLGLALADTGDLEAAVACYDRALELTPDSVAALTNRGAALEAAGRHEEAAQSYRRALALAPGHAKAHYNLGNTLKARGRLEEALACYDQALAADPQYGFALISRGMILADLGLHAEAASCAKAALHLRPDQPEALDLLAGCLLAQEADPALAMGYVTHSLAVGEGIEAKRLFCACLRRLPPWKLDAAGLGMLGRALAGPWDRPEMLAGPAARVLEHDAQVGPCLRRAVAAWPEPVPATELFAPAGAAALAAHPLLARLLTAAPMPTVEMERFLTLARAALLTVAAQTPPDDLAEPAGLAFYAALARQCCINEYAFAVSEAEAGQAEALRRGLEEALAADRPLPALWVAAAGAYGLLGALVGADRLPGRDWPEPLAAVVDQQVGQPAIEARLRESMERLTPIDDEVSLRVRRQYEENPYPRWVRVAPVDAPVAFDAFMRRRFPLVAYTPLGRDDRLDVLVAGCGTGQHALETARRFRGADVKALDLSLASLGYAKRKAAQAGATNIAFAQADILRLGALDRRFDVIEASGVLHHLADPFAGWRTLLTLLRPGGCMRLGFYSSLARRGIVRARVFLQAKGYTATAESMRRCRQELLRLPPDDPLRQVLLCDFFSLSGCRDMLFHVCEHTTDLLEIKSFLHDNGLRLLGFDLDAAPLTAYRRLHPSDQPATNLSDWNTFEQQYPDTFIEMYQFWVQKKKRAGV